MKYDVIVVGAGSSGSVIASRVSEDPNKKVLLLDAGPDYSNIEETPYDLLNSHRNSLRDHDWGFNYEPTRGREVDFPRGRVTGGSSAVNTTIALRGMPEDYDEWSDLGNSEWSWNKVLPSFNRLERDLDFGDEDYHGDAGPITIRRYPAAEMLPQHQAFLESAKQLGYPDCPDANDPDSWGAGPQPMNKLGRLRISCAVGYLSAARIRPNLTIRGDTFARRLVIKGHRCSGVEIENPDGSVEVIEGRLVVVSAGSLMSPPLLMLSGIGPEQQLQSHGIGVVVDEPGIGANLCDHPALSLVCQVKDGAFIDFDSPVIQTILRYTTEGSDKRNDMQIEQFSYAGKQGGPPMFGIAACLEYQYGRGEIRLRSADPHDHPVIDCRFCEDDRDTARLVKGFKDLLAISQTGPLADMIETVIFPDPMRPLDDDGIARLCRKLAGSGFHPCGTVKMGPIDDAMAVVDQYGCSHRVDNLVVADASIMPFVPRANINLTSIMIGEKIGEWIRTGPGRYGL